MGRAVNILEDIKTVIGFYKAIGIERLPIRTVTSGVSGIKSRKAPIRANLQIPSPEQGASGEGSCFSSEKKAALDALRGEIGDCRRCRLSKDRKSIVFGTGNPDAAILFIGEAPGREEDLQALPFVGEAGRLLTRLIEKMGFKREDVYIANIVKCRPPLNRDPEEDEIAACRPFVERQIGIIAPRVIFSLGRISSQTLTGTRIPITKLRGRFHDYNGIPLMPTFHPAYLLRNPKDKQLVWNDAQKVLEKL